MVSKADNDDEAALSRRPSSKGTYDYGTVLYRLGIDVVQTPDPYASPTRVYDVSRVHLDETLEYPHLQTEKQAAGLIQQFTYLLMANEATQNGYMLRQLVPLSLVPDIDHRKRLLRPLLVSGNPGAADPPAPRSDEKQRLHDRYHFVRHADGRPLTPKDIQRAGPLSRPFRKGLRYRSDHTLMAWCTVIGFRLRRAISRLPGVCMKGLGCAPFLSIEHKATADAALVRTAWHKASCSLYGWLVERQRLVRHPEHKNYLDDPDIRHYAYLVCGLDVYIYETTIVRHGGTAKKRGPAPVHYTGYRMQLLAELKLRVAADMLLFRDWHQAIVTWGLLVYVRAFQRDLEYSLGSSGRPSAAELYSSVLKVTCPESLLDTALKEVGRDAASQTTERSTSASAGGASSGPGLAEHAPGSRKHSLVRRKRGRKPSEGILDSAVPAKKSRHKGAQGFVAADRGGRGLSNESGPTFAEQGKSDPSKQEKRVS
jgi:hypothetical protein